MKRIIKWYFLMIIITIFINSNSFGQSAIKSILRLPDTGETMDYTNIFGEDADFTIYPPFFIINGDGTVTDTVTGLMWQQKDGGEMTIQNAVLYCDTLTLAGYNDWRLPTAHESFSILNHKHVNPALDTNVFTVTPAQYWWTADRQANDTNTIWVTNAGGGVGNHPDSETVSAGGTKIFDVRAVRNRTTPPVIPNHYTNNGDGTITDNLTKLMWQQVVNPDSMTWDNALLYADSLYYAGYHDWRIPNIKELQSIADYSLIPPIDTAFFTTLTVTKYWSSTTLPNLTNKAWYLSTIYGITTYDLKTANDNVICVRGNLSSNTGITKIAALNTNETAYPNPFSSTIKLNTVLGNELYILSNSYGQIIYNGRSIQQEDFSNLPQGIYILKIIGNKTSIIKLVKE